MRFIAENARSHSAVLTGTKAAIVDSFVVEGTYPSMIYRYRGVSTFATESEMNTCCELAF